VKSNKSMTLFGSYFTRVFYLIWKFLTQGKLILLYAAVLTVIAVIGGNPGYSCGMANKNAWWCGFWENYSPAIYVTVQIICLLLSLLFLIMASFDIYAGANKGKKVLFRQIIFPQKAKLFYTGTVCIWLISFFAPIFLAYIIFIKPANPDWRIEFCYFLILFVSSGIPFIMLRLFVGVAGFLEKGKFPRLAEIYEITREKTMVILLVFFCLLFVINLVQLKLVAYLRAFNYHWNYLISSVGTEMFGNMLKLAYILLVLAVVQAFWELYSGQLADKGKVDTENKETETVAAKEVKTVKKESINAKKKNRLKRVNAAKKNKRK